MSSLFDLFADDLPSKFPTWTPEAPPSLTNIPEVFVNFEATGLDVWGDDKPIGMSLYAGERSYYFPLDDQLLYWAKRELRDKLITNMNMRFDIHMAYKWGLDLEKLGNRVSDVGHYAALIDDHRFHYGLDYLIQDYLNETPMPRLDESRMFQYHPSEIAPRSRYNVEAAKRLKDVFWPILDEKDLQRVRALEDKVIYVTCEMERNGAPIDVPLLEKWLVESQRRLSQMLAQIAKEVGFQANPGSPEDLKRIFDKFNIPLVYAERPKTKTRPARSTPSYTSAVLGQINHPTLQLIYRTKKLISLRAKYLVATQRALRPGGILRYALNQLRAAKDDNAEAGETGTVTGRFSSSAPTRDRDSGCNIQQRMKAAKQRVSFGFDEEDDTHDDEIFLVRKLHIAGEGLLLASDMDQAQYRIFASYVNNPKVIQAYKDDPNLSFHKFMWSLIKPFASLTYRQQKDLNFAVIFGAGLTKMALMLGHITQAEFDRIRAAKDYNSEKLALTKEVKAIYDREIPEVSDLLNRASFLGRPEEFCDDKCKRQFRDLHRHFEHRGYVKTYLGRRMTFPDGDRLHKAFNGVDQGTEADYMKTKLVELHEARHETGLLLRITNHDEIVGDISDEYHAGMVNDLLNRQSFPKLRVPLTWSTSTGPNWAEC